MTGGRRRRLHRTTQSKESYVLESAELPRGIKMLAPSVACWMLPNSVPLKCQRVRSIKSTREAVMPSNDTLSTAHAFGKLLRKVTGILRAVVSRGRRRAQSLASRIYELARAPLTRCGMQGTEGSVSTDGKHLTWIKGA